MEKLKVKMDDLGVLPFQEPTYLTMAMGRFCGGIYCSFGLSPCGKTHFSWVKNSHFESFGINGEVYEPAKN